jgi:hypothetical protein
MKIECAFRQLNFDAVKAFWRVEVNFFTPPHELKILFGRMTARGQNTPIANAAIENKKSFPFAKNLQLGCPFCCVHQTRLFCLSSRSTAETKCVVRCSPRGTFVMLLGLELPSSNVYSVTAREFIVMLLIWS